MENIKGKFELVIEKYHNQGKVTIIDTTDRTEIMKNVSKELKNYRHDNQRKIRESQDSIIGLVLNS